MKTIIFKVKLLFFRQFFNLELIKFEFIYFIKNLKEIMVKIKNKSFMRIKDTHLFMILIQLFY